MIEGRIPAQVREGTGAVLEDRASPTAVPPVSRPVSRSAFARLVPPVALLAFALLAFAPARRRGADPGRPGRIGRDHSQGPTHILGAAEAAT